MEPATSELLGSGVVKNVHLVSLEPGTVRGNHVHRKQLEHVMVFGGRCLIAAEDEKGVREEMVVEADDLMLFEIQPHIRHAFKNIGERTMFLIAYTDTPYNRDNPDVLPAQIIK